MAIRPWTFTSRSDSRVVSAPAGSSWFSCRTAWITWSTPTPSDSSSAGFRRIWTSRRTPPTSVTLPDAARALDAFHHHLIGERGEFAQARACRN